MIAFVPPSGKKLEILGVLAHGLIGPPYQKCQIVEARVIPLSFRLETGRGTNNLALKNTRYYGNFNKYNEDFPQTKE